MKCIWEYYPVLEDANIVDLKEQLKSEKMGFGYIKRLGFVTYLDITDCCKTYNLHPREELSVLVSNTMWGLFWLRIIVIICSIQWRIEENEWPKPKDFPN